MLAEEGHLAGSVSVPQRFRVEQLDFVFQNLRNSRRWHRCVEEKTDELQHQSLQKEYQRILRLPSSSSRSNTGDGARSSSGSSNTPRFPTVTPSCSSNSFSSGSGAPSSASSNWQQSHVNKVTFRLMTWRQRDCKTSHLTQRDHRSS
jgi:hypothetical protein